MKNEKKVFLIAATLALSMAASPAADAAAGKDGGEFLRIVQSPRAVGMGETGAGLYGDLLGALSMNPAALGRTGYREAGFTYNAWLEGIASQQAVYAHPLGGSKGVLAGSVSMLSVPAMDGYNNSGAYAGSVDAGDLVAAVNYAVRLRGPWNDRRLGLFAGGALKYAREKLDTVAASAALADAGLLWISRTPWGDTVGLGLAAQSVGGGFKFDTVTDKAPTVLRGGASYITLAAGDPLTFAVDVKKPADSSSVLSFGTEYLLRRVVALRAGYIADSDLGSGLRFGGGVVIRLLQFDYAISSYGKFGPAHRFSLSYKFGKPVDATPHLTPAEEQARERTERARVLMRESRYYEAVLELNEALKLDPGSSEALALMRKARGLVEISR
jgi:hypothetical protein